MMVTIFQAKAILRDEKGMALLITIMTMSVLIAVTVIFHKKSWHSLLVANNYKVTSELKAMSSSGVNIGLEVLRQQGEKQKYDTLLDGWSLLGKEDFGSLFASGELKLEIVDLSGRLQVNSLVKHAQKGGKQGAQGKNEMPSVLFRLLLSGDFEIEEESEAKAIVDALIDWIDEDDRESDSGAESSYYQTLKKPYECRNGPVRYIEELLLVKGFSPELLFGTEKKKGLVEFLTVYGTDGKININTADVDLVQSLDGLITDELVGKFHSFRTDRDNVDRLEKPDWYLHTGFWPGDIVLDGKLLTTGSTFFMIKATGIRDMLSSKVTVTVHRTDRKTVELLSKKVE